MGYEKHTTFRFDPKLKEQFQEETYYNGTDMTEAITTFMANYVVLSRKNRLKSNEGEEK